MVIATTPTFRTDAFIDGAFRSAQTGDRFATDNPATGQQLTDIAAGDAPDIDLAVTAARRPSTTAAGPAAPPPSARPSCCAWPT